MIAAIATSRWFSRPRPSPDARLRLWCLPFAGGGAAAWHPWAPALGPDIEVVAVRLPGRESRLAEPPGADPAELVASLVHELSPYLDAPYALCGHSLGALLAYAVARELAAAGRPPARALIVSGVRAPHLPRTEPDLHALPDSVLIAELDGRYGGIPPELRNQPDVLALFLPALRADLKVYETFPLAAVQPLPTPLLALGGDADPVVPRAQILAWRAHTAAEFAAAFYPGGHFFIQTHLPAVTARVRDFLQRPGALGNV